RKPSTCVTAAAIGLRVPRDRNLDESRSLGHSAAQGRAFPPNAEEIGHVGWRLGQPRAHRARIAQLARVASQMLNPENHREREHLFGLTYTPVGVYIRRYADTSTHSHPLSVYPLMKKFNVY